MLYFEVGLIGAVIPFLLVALTLLQFYANRITYFINKKRFEVADQRTRKVNEMINGIKMIKFNAYEKLIFSNIRALRIKERALLTVYYLVQGVITSLGVLSSMLCCFLTFWVTSTQGQMSISKTFTVLSLFTNLQHPINQAQKAFEKLLVALVAVERLKKLSKFSKKPEVVDDSSLAKGEIVIENGNFGWSDSAFDQFIEETESFGQQRLTDIRSNLEAEGGPQQDQALHNINLKIKPSEFVAIVGQVGSGKSALLYAILNEMIPQKAGGSKVSKNGNISYISQEAFMLNDTIKNNILFGQPYDEQKYQKTLKICQLAMDLEILPGGDLTEIGERGINLSGGQKQRISIARSVYSSGDIYLIDDSLSALDADVGKKIMDQVFLEELGSTTRVMVTNIIKYLRNVDRVILVKEGAIVLDGKYDDVKHEPEFIEFCLRNEEESEQDSEDDSDFEEENQQPIQPGQEDDKDSLEERIIAEKSRRNSRKKSNRRKSSRRKSTNKKNAKTNKEKLGALTTAETRSKGLTDPKVYCYYLSAAGTCLVSTTLLFYCAYTGFKLLTDWYVGKWATKSLNLTSNQYPIIYLIMIAVLTLIVSFRSLSFGMTFSKASFTIFNKVTWNLLRRPLSFFDTTPSGVIVNRCSKDVNDADYKIPSYIFIILEYVLSMVTSLLFLCYIFPYFIAVMLIIVIFFFRSLVRFMKTLLEFKRLVKISTSPLLSRISELISGIITLRSYRMVPFIQQKFIRQSNLLAAVDYHERLSYRWFRVRVILPIWTCMVIGLIVLTIDKKYPFLVNTDPVMKGLLVSYLVTIVNLCGRLMTYSINIMKEMSSIERLYEYAIWDKHERDWDAPAPNKKDWPTDGSMDLKNVKIRYREGLPLVLRGLSFRVKTGQKVGIIGRTGSGKSTLLLALMRIVELDLEAGEKEERSGQVFSKESFMKIDGEDISRMGLHHARKSMVIIPQDPFLLQGTLRYNLDPMNEYSDAEIIEALDKVDGVEIIGKALLTRAAHKEEGGGPRELQNLDNHNGPQAQANEILDLEIADQGSNLSLGQRQLICIARALVKKPKILLMDEATANIDERTDEVIQEVINEQLEGTTVLTIAHRLNTIIRYDKIVVLDKGIKAEEGSPRELLSDVDSVFTEMVSKGGEDFIQKMKEIVGLL